MKVLIMGGAGMIGQKLLNLILSKKKIQNQDVSEITLFDIIESPYPLDTSIPISVKSGDISNPQTSSDLVSTRPDVIFHLAAIVSGQAEQEFDLGWNINARGSWGLFEAIRHLGDDYCPKSCFPQVQLPFLELLFLIKYQMIFSQLHLLHMEHKRQYLNSYWLIIQEKE